MFNREETSRIKQDFWTTFGKYPSPIPSADGLKINWINYHTGVKDVYFRMDAGQSSSAIFISLEHKDADLQDLYFEQFLELRTLLHSAVEEPWDWQRRSVVDNKVVSRIYKGLPGVSVLNKNQWPDLISFFKPRIIALDNFWDNAKYSFDALR